MSDDQILDVVQAYKDGKKIQWKYCYSDDPWVDMRIHDWDFQGKDYRITPRVIPIQKWMNLRRDGGWSWFDTKEDAYKHRGRDTSETILLREVIE